MKIKAIVLMKVRECMKSLNSYCFEILPCPLVASGEVGSCSNFQPGRVLSPSAISSLLNILGVSIFSIITKKKYNYVMKRILTVFIGAFILNAIWENLHVFLYDNYMGGAITEFILLRAALADAAMIAAITLPFILFPALQKRSWLIVLFGVILAIGIEWWALGTGRWAYNEYMLVIPVLSVGLTPAIQLGLLGYFSYKIQKRIFG